jgi:hypothetical protein
MKSETEINVRDHSMKALKISAPGRWNIEFGRSKLENDAGR